jgi:hypothetical protein
MGGACSTYGRVEVHRASWLENLKERDHFEKVNVDVRIIIKWIIRKVDGTQTGLI